MPNTPFNPASCIFMTAEPTAFKTNTHYQNRLQASRIEHRSSCHRCGNLRKKVFKCTTCPQIYCLRCYEKMVDENGAGAFFNGCPMCKKICCCSNKDTVVCNKIFHCYKKCRVQKQQSYSSTANRENSLLANLAEVCSFVPMLDTAKPAPGTPECNYQVSQCGDVPTLWEYTQTTEGMPSSVVYDEQKTSEARPTKQKRGYVNMVSAAKKQRIEEISTDALAPAVIAPDTTAPIVPSVYAAPTPAVSVPGSLQLNMDEVYATYSPSSYASPHSSIAYSPAAYSTSPSSNSLMSQSPYYPSAPSSPFSPLTPLTCPLQQHMYPLSTGYLADSLPYYTHFNTSPNGAGGAMAGVGGGVDGMAGVGAVGSQAEYVPTLLPSLSSLPFAIDVFSGEDPLIVRPHRPSLLPTPSPACKSPTAVNRITKPAKRNQPKVACAPTQLSPPLFSASNFRGLHFATTSSCSDGHPSPTTASTTAILTPANSLDSLLFPDPHPSPTGYDDLQELLNDFLAMEDMFEGEVAAYKPAGLSDIEVATANALFGDAKDASTDTI